MFYKKFNKEKILKTIDKYHKSEKHQEIVDLIDEVEGNFDAELMSLLARAIQKTEEPDWFRAYDLLMACEEEYNHTYCLRDIWAMQ